MKQLQNNFTTPEQSKRLLELGVPADSADCFYDKQFFGGLIVQTRMGSDWRKSHELFSGVFKDIMIPCWSVGRLAQITLICSGSSKVEMRFSDNNADLIGSFIDDICLLKELGRLDFSKLED